MLDEPAIPATAIDRDALTDLTLRLVKRQSLTGQEGAVAAIVHEELTRHGFAVEVDALGNVIGTFDAGPGPLVLLDSHMDTVDIGDPGLWEHDPAGEIVGSRLYGRGAMDMKGQLAASILGATAAASALRCGRIAVSASVAEEPAEGVALAQIAQRLKPDSVVICEATSLRVAHAQRGRAEILLETKGRPVHSSCPDLGINAAEAMVDIVRACRELPRPTHSVLGDGILVLTDISHPQTASSTVPGRCLATFDRRTLPGETPQTVLPPLQALADDAARTVGAHVTIDIPSDVLTTYTGQRIEFEKFAAAWHIDRRAPIVRTALDALGTAGLTTQATHYRACTNGSGTAGQLGIPTIGYGPSDMTLAHTPDEHIDIDELVTGAHGYAVLISALTTLGSSTHSV